MARRRCDRFLKMHDRRSVVAERWVGDSLVQLHRALGCTRIAAATCVLPSGTKLFYPRRGRYALLGDGGVALQIAQ